MKEKMYVTMVAVMMVGMLVLACVCSRWYTLDNCEVVEVDTLSVVVEDEQGNLWEYYTDTESNPRVGDIVTLKMFGYCTDSIEDDVIIRVIVQE